MQGERASLGSLSEAMNFEHGSSSSNNTVIDQQIRWDGDNELQDYMMSAADTNPSFSNSVYHEQRDLHRFHLGEASSSGTKNEAATSSHTEPWMGPLFAQPSSGNRAFRNVNLNADYNERLEDMNPVTSHPGLFEVNGLRSGLLPENSVRAGSSVDGRRVSCKRKAFDASIGQSSSSGAFHEFQRGESSSWALAPAYYSPAYGSNMSFDQAPRGLVPDAVSNASAPTITASSSRNYSVRVNPTVQQGTVNPAVFAAGSVIRRPVPPSLNSPGLLPAEQQQLMDLRYGHALGNVASQNPNAPRIHMPPVSRNSFNWSVSPIAAVASSSSVTPVDRHVIHRNETSQRSDMVEFPLFVSSSERRHVPHAHISRNASGGARHVASSSSRTSVQPSSPSIPAWFSNQNNQPNNQRRVSEHIRRSLLSSLVANHRAARSLVPHASLDEHMPQPGGDNTSQVQHRAYSRAGPRQAPNATSIPPPLRGLTSTSRGRNRMGASEIRSVLEHMRSGGNLRIEDVMLLNQSMMLSVADIHDRHRDMRLDVDNMTYEELLSLEERIGDVCTGLNEETISNQLKQHKYKSRTSSSSSSQEVEPCCICQEEYNDGEEIGKLECGHDFHSECIKEWLMQKNLCPICKTTGLNTTTAVKPRRERPS